MDPRIHGSKDTWIQGYMDPRIHGSRDTWIQGYMYPRIHVSKDTWIQGYKDTRILVCKNTCKQGYKTVRIQELPGINEKMREDERLSVDWSRGCREDELRPDLPPSLIEPSAQMDNTITP